MVPIPLFRDIENLPAQLRGGAVSIGNFDGVHRGHAEIVKRLVARARDVGGPAVVFTFDPHPIQLLRPDAVPARLSWTRRKARLLAELGVDAVVAYPTDREILGLSARDFFTQIILERLDSKALVEGPNFFFGRNRTGSVDLLRKFCENDSLTLDIVEPLKEDGRIVSSSWIRELIAAGEMREAARLLVRPYRIRGSVVRGAGRGATIGFPTANVEPVDMATPPLGVYAGRARTDDDEFPAAINIGPNPTFGEDRVKFEVHLIGYNQSLYGQVLRVDFLDRLRDIRSFENVAALQKQLACDLDAVRRICDASETNESARLRER